MKIDLLTDFESAIQSVSEVYFFAGFLTGFFLAGVVVVFVLFLLR